MTFQSPSISMSHFLRSTIYLLVLLSVCSSVRGAEPSAEEIIYAARLNPMGSEITLNAQLRAGSVKVPFVIAVKNGSVRYEFSEPDQFITLRLGDEESTLDEKRSGNTLSVPVSRYDDSVRGGLITYEDLALKFLYWKSPACSTKKWFAPAEPGKLRYQPLAEAHNMERCESGLIKNPPPFCASRDTIKMEFLRNALRSYQRRRSMVNGCSNKCASSGLIPIHVKPLALLTSKFWEPSERNRFLKKLTE